MGEVYLAEDTSLDREVAIKVLPEAFVADPERLGRFEREAKLLAQLNHPNIAGIYEVGESEAEPPVHFLVMELVEGPTLGERLERGPMTLDEALPVALQIAEALEEAHEKGIIHRDLKPQNIKLTEDGKVKVLDFGLAKAMDPAVEASGSVPQLSHSPTMTLGATREGVILGTAAYMSPEQAKGRPADKRADIWAFGVVLWEMLTGQRLFSAPTAPETMAQVLMYVPELDALPADTPAAARRLLARCLERDPKNRLRDIGDARLELMDTSAEESPQAASPAVSGRPRWRELLAWSLAAVGVVAAVALVLRLAAPEAETPLVRFDYTLPEGLELGYTDNHILALSPDGRSLAFVGLDPESRERRIYIRALDEVEARPVPGTEGATDPVFSPDGRSLAFFSEAKLKRIRIEGGGAVVLANAPNPRGVVWGPDGSILYSPGYTTGLWRVPASGGEPQVVVEPDATRDERTFRWPDLLPDGRTAIFTIGFSATPNSYEAAQIGAYSLDSGERTILIEEANMARFAPPDRLVFARRGTLYSVSLDLDRPAVRGDPIPVTEGLGGDPSSGTSYFATAANGTLAFIPGSSSGGRSFLTLVGRDGEAERLPIPPRSLLHPRFSPDGRQIAFTIGEGFAGGSGNVWVYSVDTQALSRVTFGGNDLYPSFSPDGRWVAFSRGEGGIHRTRADGSGSEELINSTDFGDSLPDSWSPDGKTVALTRVATVPNVYLLTVGGDAKLFQEDAASPAFSPDGRWIAYQSPGSGNSSVFVRAVDGDGKWQVSPERGGYPHWSRDGRELYYLDTGNPGRPLVKVDIEPGDTFWAGPPRMLVDDLRHRFSTITAPATNWDAAPDGQSFVFVEPERDEMARDRIELMLNWVQQLAGDEN